MIRVDVEPYCDGCLDFTPDVERPATYYADFEFYTTKGDTIIRCEYRDRCRRIRCHIENSKD